MINDLGSDWLQLLYHLYENLIKSKIIGQIRDDPDQNYTNIVKRETRLYFPRLTLHF